MVVANRQRLLAAAIGLTLWGTASAAPAAENVVFISGAFRRSIPVSDLERLAANGQAQGLLGDLLSFGKQKPADVQKMLNESVNLPIGLVSRLLNTRIGMAILDRFGTIVHPLRAREDGVVALRSAIVLGLNNDKKSLSAISFLRAYPTREMAVSIPALLVLMEKTSSIAELVRFFSESPLDGLRGPAAAAPAPTPSLAPVTAPAAKAP
ncbi:MAG: alpha/beta hydrolase [Cyanobacteria bacterium]|nr:alpha/beta hydrolase [Cyanobacteriota bacterium]